MDIETQRHEAGLPKIKERVFLFIILVRALWWFFFGPQRRKFAKVWAAYKAGGIGLCRDRAVEKFGCEKLFFIILVRALWWFFFGPQRRKFSKVWAAYKAGGIGLCMDRATGKFDGEKLGSEKFSYDPFRNRLIPYQSKCILAQCSNKPSFSIIAPVYKVEYKWLDKCIRSVVNQQYTNWEFILVDDASQRKDLRQLIDKWVSKDDRIQVYYLEEKSGIVGAINFGIKRAKGKYIGFLNQGDELTPDALTWVVWTVNKNPDSLWFYSDEDMISSNGKYHNPYFKPDFSPEFLLANMYTCHFSVYSADILAKLGGLRHDFEGSQDHDLALRLSEVISKEKIVHIPYVLYHWRENPDSLATGTDAKPNAPCAGRKAVAEALKRRNLKGRVTSYEFCPTIYNIELEPSEFPKVSIIIPTKNALSLTRKCIDSVRKHTNYPNYEILVIDNQSDDLKFLEYIKAEKSSDHLKVLKYDKPFNHSEMNNIAVKSVESDLVVFMNNDIEIISDRWLEQLVASTELDKSIANVGGLLIYPNGKVQHGGMILGIRNIAGHAHKYLDSKSTGYFGRLHALQEFCGVTAALSLIKKSAFIQVGGFNSERYPTSFNDVDICIRLRQHGFRCIYNPMVRAIHHELKTRPVTREELDYRRRLMEDYLEILGNDPFYNPKFFLSSL
jgi:GT2 family glycosyltransferase